METELTPQSRAILAKLKAHMDENGLKAEEIIKIREYFQWRDSRKKLASFVYNFTIKAAALVIAFGTISAFFSGWVHKIFGGTP